MITYKTKEPEADILLLLTLAHRQWIESRDPKDGDRYAALVSELCGKAVKAAFSNGERRAD